MDIKTYNLRIVPPSPVYDEVLAFKKTFIETFGDEPYSKSKPHVTLGFFKMDTAYETYLIKYLSALSLFKVFQMKIQGFDTFTSSKA
ncbi:hypothetical protein [Aestuariibaculum suncheonense]|uniref:2'-5' RNA ligase n=1 Tax=Aestuariibaculum suncheonense TaxID=1028745 RepID=A0A8J6UK90_9FLAO|nr:hypothetical protein [Aestuariibaculum suncheonense]MBD0835486.1 hypothetical protein [Aestuariibaculum suncheonense]